jgi:hypothetical protein
MVIRLLCLWLVLQSSTGFADPFAHSQVAHSTSVSQVPNVPDPDQSDWAEKLQSASILAGAGKNALIALGSGMISDGIGLELSPDLFSKIEGASLIAAGTGFITEATIFSSRANYYAQGNAELTRRDGEEAYTFTPTSPAAGGSGRSGSENASASVVTNTVTLLPQPVLTMMEDQNLNPNDVIQQLVAGSLTPQDLTVALLPNAAQVSPALLASAESAASVQIDNALAETLGNLNRPSVTNPAALNALGDGNSTISAATTDSTLKEESSGVSGNVRDGVGNNDDPGTTTGEKPGELKSASAPKKPLIDDPTGVFSPKVAVAKQKKDEKHSEETLPNQEEFVAGILPKRKNQTIFDVAHIQLKKKFTKPAKSNRLALNGWGRS